MTLARESPCPGHDFESSHPGVRASTSRSIGRTPRRRAGRQHRPARSPLRRRYAFRIPDDHPARWHGVSVPAAPYTSGGVRVSTESVRAKEALAIMTMRRIDLSNCQGEANSGTEVLQWPTLPRYEVRLQGTTDHLAPPGSRPGTSYCTRTSSTPSCFMRARGNDAGTMSIPPHRTLGLIDPRR